MIRWLGTGLLVLVTAVAFAAPGPATPLSPSFFNHELHSSGIAKPAVIMTGKTNCGDCHGVDKDSRIALPGADAHKPCSNTTCHDSWFLSANIPSDKNYERAAMFCLGCHDTNGIPPKPSQKAPPIFKSFNAETEFHVEMPGPDDPDTGGIGSHFEHSKVKGGRQDCRSCHIVQEDGLLKPQTPGHDQCLVCHSEADRKKGSVKVSMEMCEKCHRSGKRPDPFDPQNEFSRNMTNIDVLLKKIEPNADHVTPVISCTSESLRATIAKILQKDPKADVSKLDKNCFKHERVEHRFKPGTKDPVECSQCHTMIGDDTKWKAISASIPGKHGPVTYNSLDDIHKNPIINPSSVESHPSCGSGLSGCHQRTFNSNQCSLCHITANTAAF